MNERVKTSEPDLVAAVRRAARQEQFLEVVSPEDARARFAQHIALVPLDSERVPLDAALTRVLAVDWNRQRQNRQSGPGIALITTVC